MERGAGGGGRQEPLWMLLLAIAVSIRSVKAEAEGLAGLVGPLGERIHF